MGATIKTLVGSSIQILVGTFFIQFVTVVRLDLVVDWFLVMCGTSTLLSIVVTAVLIPDAVNKCCFFPVMPSFVSIC